MIHRHLEVPAGTPVERWPSAALIDVLERGDLADWKPLAASVARAPFGPLAERLLTLVDVHPMYGTSAAWRAFIDRCRARAEGPLAIDAAGLSELRLRHGLTQEELARRMQMSQSDLSKLERRADVRLSTLRAVATALGGRLRVLFESGRDRVEIRLTDRKLPQ